jgi:RimJ/RimL family protein N-acetyltransferase
MDTLETARLLIRPFTLLDLEAAHQVLDIDLEWSGPAFSLDQRRERLRLYSGLAQWDDTGRLYGFRAITLKSTQTLIGLCGFHPDLWSSDWKSALWPLLFPGDAAIANVEAASLELGVGYGLAHAARGQGYATEAVAALLSHALDELQIQRVFSITDRANTASVQVMRRVGMRTARHPEALVTYPGVVGVIERPTS